MIVKIGGIEIDSNSSIEEVEQLRAGLDGLGIDTIMEGMNWIANLPRLERYEFASIMSGHTFDAIKSLFTFGLF